ncbi:class I histocompatibility antigen, F10 alpha chain-like [Melanerpes formicivorus]|uniref:class I histocompatibility antigen, F10 alpha chain-like n=1 Tax=Melanerpes formicivorus TaxID=211600 RepID=UPI00358ED945
MGSRWVLGLGLLLGVLGGAVNGLHSLRYFQVAVAEPSWGLPQYVTVGYVDGVPISLYDSNTRRMEPKAEWMKANLDQGYWDRNTNINQNNQEIDRMNLDTVRARYNQSGRAQVRQQMYGCDLLEDGSTRGYYQIAYDGRDFIAFEKDSMSFTAADQAAVITKRKWEEDGAEAERLKHYLENTCVEWLKRHLSYGQAELERREPPTVVVSKRESQGILSLSCRLYGFYPRPIGVSWLKGAEVRDQDTQRGSIVPNSDGSFSTWASIEVLPQEQELYRCRVEHSSLPQPRLYSWEPQGWSLSVVLAVVAAVVAALAAVGIGVAVWKWRSGKKQQKGFNLVPPAATA